MIKWNCDICGKETHVNPQTKPCFEKQEIPRGPEEDYPQQLREIPVMVSQKRQNPATGKMDEFQTHKHADVQARAYIVRLQIGPSDIIQRDFCRECLDTVIGPLKAAFETLENVEIELSGRHDPCIVPRAIVVVEAMTAIVLLDQLLIEGIIPLVLKS